MPCPFYRLGPFGCHICLVPAGCPVPDFGTAPTPSPTYYQRTIQGHKVFSRGFILFRRPARDGQRRFITFLIIYPHIHNSDKRNSTIRCRYVPNPRTGTLMPLESIGIPSCYLYPTMLIVIDPDASNKVRVWILAESRY